MRVSPKRLLLQATTVLALLAFVGIVSATQRGIHYGELTDPGLVACDHQSWQGQRDAAIACYKQMLSKAPPTPVRAELAWALGEIKAANRWFRQAVKENPDSAELRTRWGWLFAVTHQGAEAQALFNEALALDPDYHYARLGLASAMAGGFSGAARQALEPLLEDVNAPTGVAIRASLMQAWLALEEGQLEQATLLMDRADGMLRTSIWPRSELLALRAAKAALADEPMQPWVDQALEADSGFGDAWAVPAYFMVITRRYEQAVVWYEAALKVQPNLWSARLELGNNFLRLDQPEKARQQIEAAYAGDPYNAKTVNTLRLLDTFDTFDTQQVSLTEGALKMRLARDESAVMQPYVKDLTQRSVELFTERYQYKPTQPVVVEMYPDHEDFAVRTVGLPGVGILGATFGYVVAMDSPAARSPEDFHWGTTLWHEIAHIFTLRATDHRVSRWFSEGISVFEEWRTGPVPGRQIPLVALNAMAEGKLLPLADLDASFIRPSYPQQVLVSYMQAGLTCDFIEQAFGFAPLVTILQQYKDGQGDRTAVETALGITLEQFDERFAAFIEQEFGPTFAGLEEFDQRRGDAAMAANDERWQDVVEPAARAATLLPSYVESDSPYLMLARAHRELEAPEAEKTALTDYFDAGGRLPQALDRLSLVLAADDQTEAAAKVLESSNLVAPLEPGRHTRLGQLYLALEDFEAAVREFSATLALEPHDLAAAHLNLAQAHDAAGNKAQARLQVLSALELAPNYREAQKLLMSLIDS
ncbi:MAG: tetratricopeptide repeat protein [Lysobacterales bacterium]